MYETYGPYEVPEKQFDSSKEQQEALARGAVVLREQAENEIRALHIAHEIAKTAFGRYPYGVMERDLIAEVKIELRDSLSAEGLLGSSHAGQAVYAVESLPFRKDWQNGFIYPSYPLE